MGWSELQLHTGTFMVNDNLKVFWNGNVNSGGVDPLEEDCSVASSRSPHSRIRKHATYKAFYSKKLFFKKISQSSLLWKHQLSPGTLYNLLIISTLSVRLAHWDSMLLYHVQPARLQPEPPLLSFCFSLCSWGQVGGGLVEWNPFDDQEVKSVHLEQQFWSNCQSFQDHLTAFKFNISFNYGEQLRSFWWPGIHVARNLDCDGEESLATCSPYLSVLWTLQLFTAFALSPPFLHDLGDPVKR